MDFNEEIAKVAYELYERDGRQDGKDKEHWVEAEHIVRARYIKEEKAESGPPAVKPAPKEAAPAVKKEKKSPSANAKAAEKPKKTTRTPRAK